MATAALAKLAEEVSSVTQMAPGPQRAVACARPRRHMWQVLTSFSSTLAELGSKGDRISKEDSSPSSAWLHRCQLEEIAQSCESLQELLATLRATDLDSSSSSFVRTDYGALEKQIDASITTVQQYLAGESSTLSPTHSENSTPACRTPVLEPAPEPAALELPLDQVATVTTTVDGKAKIRIRDVNDISMEYEAHSHECGMQEDGICDNGCTVGGCMHRAELNMDMDDW